MVHQTLDIFLIRVHKTYSPHIPNIDALTSDTHTLRIQYEYTQKQCVGVAIEGMDILYMGLILYYIYYITLI